MLSLGAWIAVSTVSAKPCEERHVVSLADSTVDPVPVKADALDGPDRAKRVEIEVKFVVDGSGFPRDITVIKFRDASPEVSLLPAVGQWRFRALLRDGPEVTSEAILPVRIVRYSDDSMVAMR